MAADRALIDALRRQLAAVADANKAPAMQAYMKSAMPYYGVPAPVLRGVLKTVFAEHPLATHAIWKDTALGLWRKAAFREERYAAIELTGHKPHRAQQTSLAALPIYDEM